MRIHGLVCAAGLAIAVRVAAEENVPGTGAEPAAVEAPAPPSERPARSAFTVGARFGLLVPWGRPESNLSFLQQALVMPDVGVDLGWLPSRDLWLGVTFSLAQCLTCEDSGQSLIRTGAEASFRAVRFGPGGPGSLELWVGAGVAAAWLEMEPFGGATRRVRGVELTLPRLELALPQAEGRFALTAELTFGRFTHDDSPGVGHLLTPSERTLHGTIQLGLRALFESSGPDVPPPPAGRGFLLAGALGVGVPVAPPGSSVAFLVPMRLAAGYRFGPRIRASAFVEVAPGTAGGCAPAAGCEPFLGTVGLEAELHTAPASYRDPWLGIAIGDETLLVDRRESGLDVTESWEGLLVRIEGGLQAYRSARFELGPFFSLGAGVWLFHELDAAAETRSLPVGRRLHGTAQAGIRVAWLP